MKKLVFGKRAFTLIETLLAISLFAAIALPLLTVFLQSAKADRAARDVMNANYISQNYIEQLDVKSYKEALQGKLKMELINGYYLTATVEPYGNAGKSLFTTPCVYVHLIILNSGNMMVGLPDGKWQEFSPNSGSFGGVSVSISGGSYTFKCGSTTVTGSSNYSNCAVIINASNKSTGDISSINVTQGATCKALVYCSSAQASKITVSGTSQFFKDTIAGKTSLLRVKASVYQKNSDTKPLAVSEAIISIRNEL